MDIMKIEIFGWGFWKQCKLDQKCLRNKNLIFYLKKRSNFCNWNSDYIMIKIPS